MTPETAVAPAPEVPTPSEPASLFKYSIWVHVGPGAEECTEVDERTGESRCGDPGHFHAWCRLPNQFQEREIRSKAEAARARKLRQLRKEDTDANSVLESSIEELLAEPDAAEKMASELVGYDWSTDFLVAVREVRDLDDESPGEEEGTKRFEHVDDDRVRYATLLSQGELGEEEQDEFNELREHLTAYDGKVQEHYEAIIGPKRESYLTMSEQDLAELIRQKRIKFQGHAEFMHHYNVHEWLSCTYRQPKGELSFEDMPALQGSDESVLVKLDETFADLERTAQEARGN